MARGQLLQNDVVCLKAAAANTLFNVLSSVYSASHKMHFRLQANARHPHGLFNTLLVIDHKFLRQNVQNFLIGRNGDRLGRVYHSIDIRLGHFPVANGDNTVGVEAFNMTARNSRVHGVNAATRHQLGLFNRALDRLNRGFDIDHHAPFQSAGRVRTNTHHLNGSIHFAFADDRNHF